MSHTHQLIDLGERGVLDMQPVCGDAIQSRVIQHHLINNTHRWRAIIRQMKRKQKEEIPSSTTTQ